MRNTLGIFLAALLAVPFAFADPTVLGVPDHRCQTEVEWLVHDYGGPADGSTLVGPFDSNVNECGITYGYFVLTPAECALLQPYLPPILHDQLCYGDRPIDFDGDYEYALGGAVLAVGTGSNGGAGSLACWGLVGHHWWAQDLIEVEDASTLSVPVTVAADAGFGISPCGDGVIMPCVAPQTERTVSPPRDPVAHAAALLLATSTCNPLDKAETGLGSVNPSFPPGSDGTYLVFVGDPLFPGTQGHISS